ncbi:adenine phosphoribosyltransferase [Gallaecimonas mangrovi]|uniref:adenine phosphoribosyltransferase n=1 Tax=Gallaecimonas mangrovi TaxID=2291597 RepID=UPI000E20245B|nr:adenine phosphoribosyltransferase [Gallaecimonas mangrovi]
MSMKQESLAVIKDAIKSIPDYPKPGILFRDVTSLMLDPRAFAETITMLAEHYESRGFNKVVGAEARGFIFGAPLALALGVGFVPVRKPGKLPRQTLSQTYELEYGQDMLEIHTDAIEPGDKVLLVDDLLATGGTIEATAKLVRELGGEAKDAAFIVSLPELGGIERLEKQGIEIFDLVQFDGH